MEVWAVTFCLQVTPARDDCSCGGSSGTYLVYMHANVLEVALSSGVTIVQCEIRVAASRVTGHSAVAAQVFPVADSGGIYAAHTPVTAAINSNPVTQVTHYEAILLGLCDAIRLGYDMARVIDYAQDVVHQVSLMYSAAPSCLVGSLRLAPI
jgi:hypothetical protein